MDWDSTSYTDAPHCIRRFDTGLTVSQREGEVHADGQIWSQALWEIRLGYQKLGLSTRAWDTSLIQSQFSYAPGTSFGAAAQATYTHGATAVTARPPPRWSRTASRRAGSPSDGDRVRAPRGRGRRRHDPDRPAQDERAQRAGAGGDPRGRRTRRPPATTYAPSSCTAARRCSRPAPTSRRWRTCPTPTWSTRSGGLQSAFTAVAQDPEAGGGRGHRLRARRRLRARALRGRPDRGGGREARAAGDPARHHPRAPAAPSGSRGWSARRGPRTSSSPAASCKADEALSASAWSTGWSPDDEVYDAALAWAQQFSGAAAFALRAAKESVDRGLEVDLDDRAGDRAGPVRRAVRHRGPRDRHGVVRGERPRQGGVPRAVARIADRAVPGTGTCSRPVGLLYRACHSSKEHRAQLERLPQEASTLGCPVRGRTDWTDTGRSTAGTRRRRHAATQAEQPRRRSRGAGQGAGRSGPQQPGEPQTARRTSARSPQTRPQRAR